MDKQAEQAKKKVLKKYPHLRCYKNVHGGYELFSWRLGHGFRGKGKTKEEAWLNAERRVQQEL